MNKIIGLILFSFIVPISVFASIDTNLKYGMKGQAVIELQEFLIDKGFLTGTATGNFYTLTLKAVKRYQKENKISQTGYVGLDTRNLINKEIADNTADSFTEDKNENLLTPQAVPQSNEDVLIHKNVLPPQTPTIATTTSIIMPPETYGCKNIIPKHECENLLMTTLGGDPCLLPLRCFGGASA